MNPDSIKMGIGRSDGSGGISCVSGGVESVSGDLSITAEEFKITKSNKYEFVSTSGG